LIQEYEPFTFPMGTFAALADQSYGFPHYALFSTELLRDYFRLTATGVFARSGQAGDRDSISFQNGITSVGRLTVGDIANRTPKKLLFYSRPEDHASRNMFEMAVLALSRAIESGHFEGEWEFHGIGTIERASDIRLADGVKMQVMPRQAQNAYREVLRAHDVGLSLMYTPHPSLVPIEMASAGMLVVTNSYANKTGEALRAISPNIIPVTPTIEDVRLGLKEAAANVEDYKRRVRGSKVHWSVSWDRSFNTNVMKMVKEFLDGDRASKQGLFSYSAASKDVLEIDNGKDHLQLPTRAVGQIPRSLMMKEDTIGSLKRRLAEKEEALSDLRQSFQESETRLARMTNSLGWRLLSLYGPIKHSYILPAFNWIRGIVDPPTRTPQPASETVLECSAREQAEEPLYEKWSRRCEELRYNPEKAAADIRHFSYKPTISIIMPVYNTSEEALSKALDSVLNQYYPLWELCVCDDASTEPVIREVIRNYVATDSRVKAVFSEENAGIAVASNRALKLATGEFIGLLDHDDEITPDALFEVVKTLQAVTADLIYSDEDKIDVDEQRCDPFFKPAWSPDLLFSCNYISHFGVYRKSIVEQIGGFREGFDGSQDYDLVLRFTEVSARIVHIPKILYHWRKSPGSVATSAQAKPDSFQAATRALADALRRRGIEGEVTGIAKGFHRVRRDLVSPEKVSIIIPTRDRLNLLQTCIHSIESKTEYKNYEILIVDNGSQERGTLSYLAQTPHKVIRDEGPFNYSRLNNRAAREADGKYLLLLNNDIEVISGEWLSAMVEHAQRPEVGAVGAKLLYPDNRIQHAGVVLVGGLAGHSHKFSDGYGDNVGYFGFPNRIRNYSAVTAACLMIRRKLFEEIGGLNEKNLPVAFNDVDLCLRLRRAGYLIVYTPYALLYHKESASRGNAVDMDEVSYMTTTWRNEILNDSYYSPNLTLRTEDFAVDYSKPESFFCVQAAPSEEVEAPLGGEGKGQRITIDQDNLCAISVRFGRFQRAGKSAVIFQLRQADDPNFDVCVAVDPSLIRDNEDYFFIFDPIADSSNKEYYFFLEYLTHEPDDELTIKNSPLHGQDAGTLPEDQQTSSGALWFQVFCQRQFRI